MNQIRHQLHCMDASTCTSMQRPVPSIDSCPDRTRSSGGSDRQLLQRAALPHAICSRLAAISFTVDEYDAAPTVSGTCTVTVRVCAEHGAIPGGALGGRSNVEASDP
jgi:hypothetical protein